MIKCDIAVIGAGASGLCAAISAKRAAPGLDVLIAERLMKPGKKLLATGNGRCNLSNLGISEERYHGSCTLLLDVTADFDTVGFFDSLGIVCVSDECGRVYPRSMSASAVCDTLILANDALGNRTVCGVSADTIEKHGKYFSINGGEISARAVILCGGGHSQSALGSDGSMAKLCSQLGIRTAPFYPCLTPLLTRKQLVYPLKGVRVHAKVTYISDGKAKGSQEGEVQFTDGCISGICVFDLSYLYESCKKDAFLSLDLMPEKEPQEVAELAVSLAEKRGAFPASELFDGVLPPKLGEFIVKNITDKPLSEPASCLTVRELSRAAELIKALRFPVTGAAGAERSQVSGGGVLLSGISDDFSVKKIPGLYVCGEALDIFGDCGGFNLDFAFSSGGIAGKACAAGLTREDLR